MANDKSISSDLIRGHIETIILRSLYDGDKHGNEICLDIEDKSGGEYEIKQPTLYSALKRLEETGLVHAYWSSGVGGRRRYFKLTDKGRETCEDNFLQWIHSRNVIDKLISNGNDLGYPAYIPHSTPPKFDPSEYENYSFTANHPTSDYDDFSSDNNIDLEVNNITLKAVDDSAPEEISQAIENESNLVNLTPEDNAYVTQLSFGPQPQEEPQEQVIEEETAEEHEEPVIEAVEINPEDDDTYIYVPGSQPSKKYYKILQRLFPRPEPKFTDTAVVENVQPTVSQPKEEIVVAEPVKIEEEAEPVVVAKNIKVEEEKTSGTTIEIKQVSGIDYSDIIGYAALHGFRIKTADKTNKTLKGKLYINRLNCLSAFLHGIMNYLIILAVSLPFLDIINFGVNEYLMAAGVIFAYPLLTLIILIFASNKTVDKIPTLKYSVTSSIVLALNLILLDFVLILLFSVDFYKLYNLLVYIVYPFCIFITIPLLYVIKYILLSKGLFKRMNE